LRHSSSSQNVRRKKDTLDTDTNSENKENDSKTKESIGDCQLDKIKEL